MRIAIQALGDLAAGVPGQVRERVSRASRNNRDLLV